MFALDPEIRTPRDGAEFIAKPCDGAEFLTPPPHRAKIGLVGDPGLFAMTHVGKREGHDLSCSYAAEEKGTGLKTLQVAGRRPPHRLRTRERFCSAAILAAVGGKETGLPAGSWRYKMPPYKIRQSFETLLRFTAGGRGREIPLFAARPIRRSESETETVEPLRTE